MKSEETGSFYMGHKHAKNMMLYAQDALATEKPWEMWEIGLESIWENMYAHPDWNMRFEYRRKPRRITIGGIKVPESMREAPEYGSTYYCTVLDNAEMFDLYYWVDDELDKLYLQRGLIHSTKEAAILHAKALILISGGMI